MAKPAVYLLTQRYCRKLVGPLLANARHQFAKQIDSVPPPTRSAGMFVFLFFNNYFYGLAQLRALGVPFLMLLLGTFQEVTKKSDFGKPKSQDVPSWISLSVPRYKEKQEKDIKFLSASLAILLPRAAGKICHRVSNFMERNGKGPMSSRELFFGIARALPLTGIGEVARANFSFPLIEVLEGVWGNFFQEVPLRASLTPE